MIAVSLVLVAGVAGGVLDDLAKFALENPPNLTAAATSVATLTTTEGKVVGTIVAGLPASRSVARFAQSFVVFYLGRSGELIPCAHVICGFNVCLTIFRTVCLRIVQVINMELLKVNPMAIRR